MYLYALCKDKIEMEISLHRSKASRNSIGWIEKDVANKTN